MPWHAATTSFVGRRQEVGDVRRMLQRSRLVTVTGTAGTGKTRVAIRSAQHMRRAFADGVHYIELSGLEDPAQLEQYLAQTLDSEGELTDHLADRRMLLVLDNCDHLVEACSQLVQTLLRAAPGLHVLVTSGQALRAPGEHTVIVRPLAVPGSDWALPDLGKIESVTLLLDRATAVDPDFLLTEDNASAIAELCRRLEGIPLAIELAAVRLPGQPAGRLLDLMDEHPTMRAAIEWSHELCTPGERLLWQRLTVFPAAFDLAAAELVCSGEDLPDTEVYPTLAALVERSIVVRERDGHRTAYRMLDSVREFGAKRLQGAAELRRRHREHYFAVAGVFAADRADRADGAKRPERAEGADGGECVERDRVEEIVRARADWPNFRAALESYAADPEAREQGLEMGLRLGYLWIFGGMTRYGRQYLERLLAITRGPDSVRLGALLQLAHMSAGQGDLAAARKALDEAEAPAARLGLLAGLQTAKMLGTLSFCEGDLESAERHLRQSIDGLTDGPLSLHARVELGLTLLLSDRVAEAEPVLWEARTLCLEAGDGSTAAWAEISLALVRRLRGELAQAEEMALASLRTQASLHVTFGRAFCVEVLGWLAADQGHPARAVRLLNAAHRLWAQEVSPLFGSPVFAAERERYHKELRGILGQQYGKAAAAGRAMASEEAIAYALSANAAPTEEAAASSWAPLTPREADVAELVADGLTNRLIAQRLVVARRTVDTHVENILAKLGFAARSQIAAWAARVRRRRE